MSEGGRGRGIEITHSWFLNYLKIHLTWLWHYYVLWFWVLVRLKSPNQSKCRKCRRVNSEPLLRVKVKVNRSYWRVLRVESGWGAVYSSRCREEREIGKVGRSEKWGVRRTSNLKTRKSIRASPSFKSQLLACPGSALSIRIVYSIARQRKFKRGGW